VALVVQRPYNSRTYWTERERHEANRNMLLHIHEDIHGYIYEPHSEQSEYYYTTFEGSEVLRASGWKPFCMHRVSRFVHEALLIDGWLVWVSSSEPRG
jgi:hypothetical protein